jgi:hypothetical protein
MLKIKDNVDLKELKKFGFELNKDKTDYEQKINGNWWDIRVVNVEDRWIEHYTEEIGYWAFTDDDDLLAITFDDLIKADMVEKLEE